MIIRTLPLVLLLLLSCSVSAFVHRTNLNYNPSIARGRKGNDVSSRKQFNNMPSPLRVRGGGGATSAAAAPRTKLSSTTVNNNNDEDDKSYKVANKALQSMRNCCKMCVAAVLADVIAAFVDDEKRSHLLGPIASLHWTDYVDIFDSLSVLVFAGGIWHITRLYWASFAKSEEYMDKNTLLNLFRTKAWIWGIVTLNHCFLAVSAAVALPTLASKGLLRSVVFDRMTSSHLCTVLVVVLVMGGIVVGSACERTAEAEIRTYREKHGIIKETTTVQKLTRLRKAGYNAYRNQALCAGSFGVIALLDLAKWIVTFNGDYVGHLFSISDVMTPFIIGSLLFKLNRALLRGAIAEIVGSERTKMTGGDNNGNNGGGSGDEDIYRDLFIAQAGFYDKGAETLKNFAIFGLLPYIAGVVFPYVSIAAEWISPRLFAKVIEAFST